MDPAARTRELIAEGVSPAYAGAVARGLLDLSDAVARMARDRQAALLEERHGLPRSVAMQVALGQIPLEDVLRRLRFEQHRAEHRDRTGFVAGQLVGLSTFGGSRPTGRLTEVSLYEFVLAPESGPPVSYRKIAVKYVHALDDLRRVRKATRVSRERAAPQPEPATNPKDRYPLSDRRLFDFLDRESDLEVLFLDGEVLHGRVSWVSRFEFGLALKGGAEAAVCRHALSAVARS